MTSCKKYVLVNSEGSFGKKPNERTIPELLDQGIINLDKNKGPTSHLLVDYVKRILKLKKAGHSGTLDPGVTGVQPIALGRATRITHFLLTAPKEYVGIMHLHQSVEAQDKQNANLGTSERSSLSEKKLRKIVGKFVGEITQLPPVKSAVKREKRKRKIYQFEILEIDGQDILFRVKCQAGTYIRKLCHDLGQELKVGANMAELRRTQAGPFTEDDNLVTLVDLQDAYHFYQEENNPKFLEYCLQPIENAVKHLPKVWVLDSTIQSLTHGRDLAIPGVSALGDFDTGEIVAVMTLKGELVAVGESMMSAEEASKKKKGIVVKTKKVFMEQI